MLCYSLNIKRDFSTKTLIFLRSKIPIVLSIIGLSINIWILIAAPNMTLLPLSVAAPELSIWLLCFSSIGLASQGIAIANVASPLGNRFAKILNWVGISLSIVNIIISASPLMQLSGTIDLANAAMANTFGANYLAGISPEVRSTFRSQPYTILEALQGIDLATPIRINRKIEFAAPAGVPLTLNLYQPPIPGKYPTVIQIYGGAWKFGTPDSNEDFSRYLAARGYVVVAIDYRHAPKYHFPAQLIDIRTALDYIKAHMLEWEVDPGHIALIGRSAGGHLATLIAYQQDSLPFKAIVSYYAPVDLTAGYLDPPVPDPIDSRQVLRDFLGGTPTDFPDLYDRASPYQQVNQKQIPSLLIYGGKDHLVEARFGKRLADKLQSFGTLAVYIKIPWADHAFDAIFSGTSNQLALYYTERFLAKTVR
jgi:acetyl esterase/lipase